MATLSSCLIWQIISFILPPNEYGCVCASIRLAKWACDRLTEDADIGKKNHIFSEAHFDLGGYVKKQNCRTHTLKSRIQNESLFDADFGPEA